MQPQNLLHSARALHLRVQQARGNVAVYYDANGVFRVSPVAGYRFSEVVESFPDCIVGVFTPAVAFDHFFEDFEFFCHQMGFTPPVSRHAWQQAS